MALKIEQYELEVYYEVIDGWSRSESAANVAERLQLPLDVVREVYESLDDDAEENFNMDYHDFDHDCESLGL